MIGHSGSGKSTMLSLLCQERQPTAGQILVDGSDLNLVDFSLAVNRNHSHPTLLTGTQKDNASIYGTYPSFKKLDDTTPLSGLSGGQLQLLESQRLFSANKPLILLDESFRAMDQQLTSKTLCQFLTSDATVFAVSHDVSEEILSKFDEILMFEAGHCIFREKYDALSQFDKYITLVKGGAV